jgi:general stress protein CsbA
MEAEDEHEVSKFYLNVASNKMYWIVTIDVSSLIILFYYMRNSKKRVKSYGLLKNGTI